ncbi:hypothetical protein LEP1GSC050_2416 [Leptospira broomii serovar Hurstbridge str. 5399]|uniref:Uncharacterized protein n=1 Tax=Leptospira broomii serovar Hurstbridge str. 5399 TaxID=1049789 RepID=T0GGX3_9LEPT|nr:hypothetical protein LEP1GSC050_2416 [Leptospira broomii serovar Hurstbridge str. 5399]
MNRSMVDSLLPYRETSILNFPKPKFKRSDSILCELDRLGLFFSPR